MIKPNNWQRFFITLPVINIKGDGNAQIQKWCA